MKKLALFIATLLLTPPAYAVDLWVCASPKGKVKVSSLPPKKCKGVVELVPRVSLQQFTDLAMAIDQNADDVARNTDQILVNVDAILDLFAIADVLLALIQIHHPSLTANDIESMMERAKENQLAE